MEFVKELLMIQHSPLYDYQNTKDIDLCVSFDTSKKLFLMITYFTIRLSI